MSLDCLVPLLEHHHEFLARCTGLHQLSAVGTATTHDVVLADSRSSNILRNYLCLVVDYNVPFHTFLYILPFPLLSKECPRNLQTVPNRMLDSAT